MTKQIQKQRTEKIESLFIKIKVLILYGNSIWIRKVEHLLMKKSYEIFSWVWWMAIFAHLIEWFLWFLFQWCEFLGFYGIRLSCQVISKSQSLLSSFFVCIHLTDSFYFSIMFIKQTAQSKFFNTLVFVVIIAFNHLPRMFSDKMNFIKSDLNYPDK